MKLNTLLIITLLFATVSCKSQTVAPTALPLATETALPTETSVPTATLTPTPLPTEIDALISTPSDVFGAIPLNSVQAFTLEPVAQAIFEKTLGAYVASDAIQEYRVDHVSIFPSGDGGLIAEIMYSIRAENDPWAEDFGILGADGWITGKCSRFDFVSTETEHQLKNKRLCS